MHIAAPTFGIYNLSREKSLLSVRPSNPMSNKYKHHPGSNMQLDYNNIEEGEDVEVIRPSIPLVIPLAHHGDVIGKTSSLPNEDGDNSSGCSFSSLISEVTLMTFSEEKAAMLRSEFLSRVQQESHTRPLSRDEKLALLAEIQADQDKKFKVEMQRQETKRSMDKEGERTRHEFFDRLNALRVNNSFDGQRHYPRQQMEDYQIDDSERESSPDRAGGGRGHSEDGVIKSDTGAKEEEDKVGQIHGTTCRRISIMRRNRRISGLSSSDITEKRCNSQRSLLANSYGKGATSTASMSSSVYSDSESILTTPTNTSSRAAIEELIALKMEIANQQATIDTITARLHNFEIDNSKLSSSLSREKKARRDAENSNETLREQLRQCREREVELRREVMASSVTRPPMMKQISTVDWGDADGSDRSILDRLERLEEENEKLIRENERLRQQQEVRQGADTECTEQATSLDISVHKTSQPTAPEPEPCLHYAPRRKARQDLGASILTLGSSIKLISSKMVRSGSEASVRARSGSEASVRATDAEETSRERSPSSGDLNATAANVAQSKYPKGGTILDQKAQRRRSTGDGWRQKMAEEEGARAGSRRRWGSYNEEEEEDEGKGIGGWLNGFGVFGKVDEEVDGGGGTGPVGVKE